MKVLLVLFCLMAMFVPSLQASSLTFDFDGNGVFDDRDLAIAIAWIQMKNAGLEDNEINVDDIKNVAGNVLPSVTTVERLPSPLTDSLLSSVSSSLTDDDLAFFIAYNQLGNAGVTPTLTTVKSVAANIISLASDPGKLPGTPIGDSSFTTTIDGITPD